MTGYWIEPKPPSVLGSIYLFMSSLSSSSVNSSASSTDGRSSGFTCSMSRMKSQNSCEYTALRLRIAPACSAIHKEDNGISHTKTTHIAHTIATNKITRTWRERHASIHRSKLHEALAWVLERIPTKRHRVPVQPKSTTMLALQVIIIHTMTVQTNKNSQDAAQRPDVRLAIDNTFHHGLKELRCAVGRRALAVRFVLEVERVAARAHFDADR